LVLAMCDLPMDLVGHMLLFGSMADAVNAMGLTCKTLCKSVWDQRDLWITLGGPAFLQDSSNEIQMLHSAAATRSAFRRWVFGIGFGWSHQFVARVDLLSAEEALQDAFFLISGLYRSDAPAGDICRLVDGTARAIGRAADDDDDSLATALVLRCRSRPDLLSALQLQVLEVALDEAAERAMLRHLQAAEDDAVDADDFDELAEKVALEKDDMSKFPGDDLLVASPEQAINNDDAAWLSQRFMMVMSEHHGWD